MAKKRPLTCSSNHYAQCETLVWELLGGVPCVAGATADWVKMWVSGPFRLPTWEARRDAIAAEAVAAVDALVILQGDIIGVKFTIKNSRLSRELL